MMVSHFLTFDVEHWYEGYRYRYGSGWELFPARDQETVERLLLLLDEFQTKATFFVTGTFAEEFPALVNRIATEGHELASHSYSHTVVHRFPDIQRFREDLHRSVCLIEDISGEKVLGFRAPKWSIPRNPECFYEALLTENLVYDSSLFPGITATNVPDSPFVRELLSGQKIWEIPATTLGFATLRIPAAGGFWLRLFPKFITQQAVRQGEAKGLPRMVYLHPYDLDPACPRLYSSLTPSVLPFMFARYYGLARTEKILRELFVMFRFSCIQEWLSTDEVTRSGGPVVLSSPA